MEFAITVAGSPGAELAGELPVLHSGPPFKAEGSGQAKATVAAMGAEEGWDEVAPGASQFNHHNSSNQRYDQAKPTGESVEENIR